MTLGIAVKPDIPRPSTRASEPPQSAGFAARLDGATLADLVQMECMRGSRRVIRVTSGTRVGYLFFDRGQVVHATSSNRSGDSSRPAESSRMGESAALWMLRWKNGTFEATDQPWPLRNTIQSSWQSLVLIAAQQEDEATRDSVSDSSAAPDSSEMIATSFLIADDDPSEMSVVPAARETAGTERQSVEPTAHGAETGEEHRGVHRAVRLDAEGNVLSHIGALGDFADLSSYAVRLCSLIGESLGLERFVGIECTSDDKSFLSFWDEDTIVALEAEAGADIDAYRKRAGI